MRTKAQNDPMERVKMLTTVDRFDLATLPRCGAKTRAGTPCQRYGTKRNGRCRLHGGASTGPPKGNRNALKSGLYTREAIEERRRLRALLKRLRTAL